MTVERKCGLMLGVFSAAEGSWLVVNIYSNGWGPVVHYLGYAPGRFGLPKGWIAAAVVTAIFVGYAQRLPSVRANLIRPSGLKALALTLAVTAGILEEVIFRRWVMESLRDGGHGAEMQVAGAGLIFGVVHFIWGAMGRSLRAAIGAMMATGGLGAMLGVVYLLGGRSLAPCIASHFLINAFIEPGLMLAATRGEMGRSLRD